MLDIRSSYGLNGFDQERLQAVAGDRSCIRIPRYDGPASRALLKLTAVVSSIFGAMRFHEYRRYSKVLRLYLESQRHVDCFVQLIKNLLLVGFG